MERVGSVCIPEQAEGFRVQKVGNVRRIRQMLPSLANPNPANSLSLHGPRFCFLRAARMSKPNVPKVDFR